MKNSISTTQDFMEFIMSFHPIMVGSMNKNTVNNDGSRDIDLWFHSNLKDSVTNLVRLLVEDELLVIDKESYSSTQGFSSWASGEIIQIGLFRFDLIFSEHCPESWVFDGSGSYRTYTINNKEYSIKVGSEESALIHSLFIDQRDKSLSSAITVDDINRAFPNDYNHIGDTDWLVNNLWREKGHSFVVKLASKLTKKEVYTM